MDHNLKIKPRETDWLFGSTSPIQFKAVSNGTWKVWFNEDQRNPNFDDDGCAVYAACKSVDVQIDFLISIGKIPATLVAQFTSMGFMDSNSLDGKAHFHSSPRFTEIMTGNGTQGNSMPECFDAIRANGLVPWASLPFTQAMTQEEYFNPTNVAELKALGLQVLNLLGGKNFLQYHWIYQDATKNMSLMQNASLQAPCGLGIAVDSAGWNQATPVDPPASQAVQHAVMETEVFAPSCDVSDNYPPYNKNLDAGYPIPFCIQAVITLPIIPPPLPAPLPPNPTVQQESSWIQSVSNWIASIINQLKGRPLGSINPMSKFLSLNVQDFIKGIIVAIFTPCIIYVGQVLQATTTGGTFAIDWSMLLKIGVSAGIGYLVKNYLTNSSGVPLSGEL